MVCDMNCARSVNEGKVGRLDSFMGVLMNFLSFFSYTHPPIVESFFKTACQKIYTLLSELRSFPDLQSSPNRISTNNMG